MARRRKRDAETVVETPVAENTTTEAKGPKMIRVRGGTSPVRAHGEKSGLKVSQAYLAIFRANERLAAGKAAGCDLSLFKDVKAPLTDEAIKDWLQEEYGTRGNNNHLNVSRNRKAYVDGIYPKKKDDEDERKSTRYNVDGDAVAPRMRKVKAEETPSKGPDAPTEETRKSARRRSRTKK